MFLGVWGAMTILASEMGNIACGQTLPRDLGCWASYFLDIGSLILSRTGMLLKEVCSSICWSYQASDLSHNGISYQDPGGSRAQDSFPGTKKSAYSAFSGEAAWSESTIYVAYRCFRYRAGCCNDSGKGGRVVAHRIAYASQKLRENSTVLRWTRSCMQFNLWALPKFEPYLYSQKFMLVTDHQALGEGILCNVYEFCNSFLFWWSRRLKIQAKLVV